jgi:ribosomal-protein-alanine N-acetyltransferase
MPEPPRDLYPPIATARLRLRCVALGDAAATAALMTPGISDTVASWPPSVTKGMALERIKTARAAAASGQAMPCAIIRDCDQALLGWAGVNRLAGDATGDAAGDDRRGELGYWIGEPFQGQGYATEAATALISAAFDTLDLDTIQAGARLDNEVSFSVLQKLGMRAIGERTVFAQIRDRHEVCRYYEISSGEIPPAV